MSETDADLNVDVVDTREMALVLLVERDGTMRCISAVYGPREQAQILSQAAAAAERRATARGPE